MGQLTPVCTKIRQLVNIGGNITQRRAPQVQMGQTQGHLLCYWVCHAVHQGSHPASTLTPEDMTLFRVLRLRQDSILLFCHRFRSALADYESPPPGPGGLLSLYRMLQIPVLAVWQLSPAQSHFQIICLGTALNIWLSVSNSVSRALSVPSFSFALFPCSP